ncbi:MAG: amino acid adenylation domain-containing protein [bacterium]|nr:amino acid adenylation domain-containing protein [bacterium]
MKIENLTRLRVIANQKTDERNYWLEKLSGIPAISSFPYSHTHGDGKGREMDVYNFSLPEAIARQLLKLSGGSDIRLHIVLAAGMVLLVDKYTGNKDIVLGTPIYDQEADGDFSNTILVLRNEVGDDDGFKTLLMQVRETLVEAADNGTYPVDVLLEQMDITDPGIGDYPLFDISFLLENIQDAAYLEPYRSNTVFSFLKTAGGIDGHLTYNTLLYNRRTVESIVSHLEILLQTVLFKPDIPCGRVEIVSENERKQLLQDFNDTQSPYPEDKIFAGVFEDRTAEAPDSIAVVFKEHQLTYRALNEKANRAARLLRAKGVGPDTIIGIMTDHSLEMIEGLMAVIKAGAPFLPMEYKLPGNRLLRMLADCNAPILLTTSHILDNKNDINQALTGDAGDVPAGGGTFQGEIILLDSLPAACSQNSAENLLDIALPSHPAYIIFTSGSTGMPKGVVIQQKSLLNLCCWHTRAYAVAAGDRASKYAGFGFDASVWEIFPYLNVGAALYVLPDQIKLDIRLLNEYFETHAITFAFLPTQVCEQFIRLKNRSLKVLLTGGDKLSHYNTVDYRLFNNYGPSENTVVATYYKVGDHLDNIPIGMPVDNTRVYILDRNNCLLPVGVPGECCISGESLAVGYLNRVEQTVEKFVPDPFRATTTPADNSSAETKMYRTGDLACRMEDGNILFLGRIDTQVKIRGYRIELGEIESKLGRHDNVKETTVTVKALPQTGDDSENKHICAYVVPRSEIQAGPDEETLIKELKDYLARELPDYMIPAYFMLVERIPLTANGKVDWKALPAPAAASESAYEAPRNKVEEKLVEVWKDVFGMEQVGINDNFFHLGGDSIKAIQISARLQQHHLKLEVTDLLTGQTIKQAAAFVKTGTRNIPQQTVEGHVPLTPIQQWFFSSRFTDSFHFNQSIRMFNEDSFDQILLQKAFDALVLHHDALRMQYRMDTRAPGQWNRGSSGKHVDLKVVNLETADQKDIDNTMGDESAKLQHGFHLEHTPLIKPVLFKTTKGDHLLIIIHHLVIDGVSWRILFEDLETAYRQLQQEEPHHMGKDLVKLPEKTDSFRHWASCLTRYAESKELLEQLPYWSAVDETPVQPLPRDGRVEKENKKIKYLETVEMTLEPNETSNLCSTANRAYNTEINDLLLTALGLAVRQWSGLSRLCINLEGHGRELIHQDIDIRRTVGWFTTQYPVVLEPGGPDDTKHDVAEDIGRAIKVVKETLRRIPGKGIGYGLLRYLTPDQKKGGKQFNLNPEISFNYLGQIGGRSKNDMDADSPPDSGPNISPEMEQRLPIDVNGMITNGCLNFTFSYNQFEFQRSRMEQLAEQFKTHLLAIVRHCTLREKTEYTPSDLSLVEMSLEEFQQLERRVVDEIDRDAEIQWIYPLSPMQAGMLYHAMESFTSSAYFEQTTITLQGELQPELLEKSFNLLLERYDILRTNFFFHAPGIPLQVVIRRRNARLHFEDISQMEQTEEIAYLEGFKNNDRERGFHLETDQLMRIALFHGTGNRFTLVLSFHHILMDGWCMGIIFRELVTIYNSLTKGESLTLEPATPYIEFIRWLQTRDRENGLEYWSRCLEDYDEPAALLPGGPPRDLDRYQLQEHRLILDEPLSADLDRMVRENRVTLNALFQSVWGLLLQRYNDRDDVVYGVVVSGRPAEIPGIEHMVGLFINTVPLRVTSDNNIAFRQFLEKVHEDAVAARAYEYLPLAEIQAASPLKGQLIDHILVFENFPVEEEVKTTGDGGQGLEVTDMAAFEQTNYQFNIIVVPGPPVFIRLSYNAFVYDEAFIAGVSRHLEHILRQVAEEPGLPVRDMSLVGREERELLLHTFNDTGAPFPRDKTIHGLFEEQVSRTPDSPAVASPQKRLTYDRLNRQAEQVAALLRQKGVRPGEGHIVVVKMERSVEMMVGIWGILKAGGAYLPMEPTYPPERITFILADSNAEIILTTKNISHQNHPGDIIYLEEFLQDENTDLENGDTGVQKESQPNVRIRQETSFAVPTGASRRDEAGRAVQPTDLAYIIYTSGSTGKPKGVLVEHRPVINRLHWMQGVYPMDHTDRILQKTPVVFDVSVWELFGWSFQGAALYLLGPGEEKNPEIIVETVYTENITALHFVPSMLTIFLDYIAGNDVTGKLAAVRFVFASGEALGVHQVKQFNRLLHTTNNIRLINLYGPTEATVEVSRFDCTLPEEDIPDRIPIGKPINNIQLMVLDRRLQLQPVGIAGELFIAGTCLSRGYLNRPQLTAETFIHFTQSTTPPIPYSPAYRTGDLACLLPDGNISFLGRMDFQVKIRGFRIELGEIECRLLEHPLVLEAITIVHTDLSGDHSICAYITWKKEKSTETNENKDTKPPISNERTGIRPPLDDAQLGRFLLEKLPQYMVPSHFVSLESMPLTTSGKINRKALPEPDVGPTAAHAAPEGEIEKKLACIWADVLGITIDNISVTADFFKSGGHSLKAMALVSRIHKQFNVKMTLADIFKHPAIKDMARFIRNMEENRYAAVTPAELKSFYPLSPAQRRLFILHQVGDDNTGCNMPQAVTVRGETDIGKLERVFRALIRRHDSLRTSFEIHGEKPIQIIRETVGFNIEHYDLKSIAPDQQDEEVKKIISAFIRPFILSRPPLLRVGAVETAPDSHVLVVDTHHIISDAASQGLLVRDFLRLYYGEELPPPALQYKDYSQWLNSDRELHSLQKQEQYWLETLEGDIPLLVLPADYLYPEFRNYQGGQVTFHIDEEPSEKLKELGLEHNATLFMVTLALYYILLAKLSDMEDIIVGSIVEGRSHADLTEIIGVFVNMLALRSFPSQDKTFLSFLREVRERTLDAFVNQDYQYDDLLDRLSLERKSGRNPLLDVGFQLLERENPHEEEAESAVKPYNYEGTASKLDMTFHGIYSGAQMSFTIEYSTQLFEAATAESFGDYYKKITHIILENPDITIGEIDMVADLESRELAAKIKENNENMDADFDLDLDFDDDLDIAEGADNE